MRYRPHPSTECEPHPVALATESLVPITSIGVSGTLEDDLALLQDHLEDNVPCYVLARLDNPPSEWLIISYVPEAAQVRQKVGASPDHISLLNDRRYHLRPDALRVHSQRTDEIPRIDGVHRQSVCYGQGGRHAEWVRCSQTAPDCSQTLECKRARDCGHQSGREGSEWELRGEQGETESPREPGDWICVG